MSVNLNELNEDQKKAATCIEGPVIILAGAGSGKTRTITYRIAYMIDAGIDTRNILAITFTNKAAKEMKERALALLDDKVLPPTLTTFHSFGLTIMRKSGILLGYRKNIQVCDAEDSVKRIKKIVKNKGFEKELVSQFADMISRAKDKLLEPSDIEVYEQGSVYDQFKQVYYAYQAGLKNDNMVDFDDLIMKPVQLFRSNPAALNWYQDHYRYLMVDEYQDTSHSQFELVRLLADKYKNICVVGDDYQSIYGFRGADISNILNFKNHYPSAYTVTIGQNYRSTHVIVNAAAAVIENNPDQLKKKLCSMQDNGIPIPVHAADDDRDEANFVANKIMKALDKGRQPKEFAVLYRKNAFSRSIEDALMHLHIPYRIFGGLSFYQRSEIKDMVAYLKLLDVEGSGDRIALERVINVPKRGIGQAKIKMLDEIAEKADDNSFNVAMTAPEFDKVKGFISFREAIKTLQESAKELPLDELILKISEVTDYPTYLMQGKSKSDDEDEVKKRMLNISELANKANEYIKEHEDMSKEELLSTFLADIALLTDQDMAKDDNVVSLMTMHRSKGLEFEYVFIIGCEEGCFPDDPPYMGNTLDVQEDRRLCYVGMTRAKKVLFMTYSKQRYLYGQIKINDPSRYLDEIPDEYKKEV